MNGGSKQNLYLGFGFDADVEEGEPGGEKAGKEFAGEGVEEVEARLSNPLEASPPLHHSHV